MSMKGKVVVFSGKLSLSRSAMQKEAASYGLKIGKSITSKVDYLVCGPQIAHNASNAKRKKAIACNVEVITEDEYRLKLIELRPKQPPIRSKQKQALAQIADFGNWDILSSLSKSDHL